MELVSFSPQTSAYIIYYPEAFLLNEDDDGIVTITSPESAANLTLSSYNINQKVTATILAKFFDDITEDYEIRSDLRTLETSQDLLIEKAFHKDGVNWIFWAIAKGNQIVVISANSEDKLNKEDYNLFRFMIDKMEIPSTEFEKSKKRSRKNKK